MECRSAEPPSRYCYDHLEAIAESTGTTDVLESLKLYRRITAVVVVMRDATKVLPEVETDTAADAAFQMFANEKRSGILSRPHLQLADKSPVRRVYASASETVVAIQSDVS